MLPTRGAARCTNDLWVGKYLKTVTYQEVLDELSSAALGRLWGRAARVELFQGWTWSQPRPLRRRPYAKYTRTPLTWSDYRFAR
ncbi:hypothetical protein ACFVYF_16105 [Streptomyces sp. NPDC058274]|uniref:hypothetical protein n=1 Tax=Streptomyces sp. NPDC058274 TaxID=3346416 RepID=UPI0036E2AD94